MKSPESFLPLKANYFHIMVSLSDGEQHGYGIMQEVFERTHGKVRLWPATLYSTFKRLTEEDLIEESEDRPRLEDDDPRRRYYHLTSLGRCVLEAETQRLSDLVSMLKSKRITLNHGAK